jgi:hypothetical protein
MRVCCKSELMSVPKSELLIDCLKPGLSPFFDT